MRIIKKNRLTTRIYPSREEMGAAAAQDIAACIAKLLKERETINMIFAAAPSQNEVLRGLREDKDIPWQRINAFHMDEYVGLRPDALQGFANFLKEALFDHVPLRSVHLLNGNVPPEKEIERYGRLLEENPVDIVCMGIGENGHIAFNDPHVADFDDPLPVKVVDLDETCRMQQVHDGCFVALGEVPTHALTLTVPALARAKYHFCVVPAQTKAQAVRNTICGEIGAHCPATVLRTLPNAIMYCDRDSAKLVSGKIRLGVITDEVSQNIDEAAEFAVRFGLDALELRSVNDRGPFAWTDEDVAQIKAAAGKHGLRIAAIASPLFKCDIDDEEAVREHIEGFRRCIGYCKALGCSIIRGFDFWKAGVSVEVRAKKFEPIVRLCEENEIYCVLENEPATHGATPADVLQLVNAIGSEWVKVLFDPGNVPFAVGDTRPYPDDYEAVKAQIKHMHIKDAVRENGQGRAVCVGTGLVDCPGLLKALMRDGYDGYVCLETHYRKAAELNENQLALPGGSVFSEGAEAASCECMEAFMQIINRVEEGKA